MQYGDDDKSYDTSDENIMSTELKLFVHLHELHEKICSTRSELCHSTCKNKNHFSLEASKALSFFMHSETTALPETQS